MVKLTASVERLIGRNPLLREALAEAIEAFDKPGPVAAPATYADPILGIIPYRAAA
jgi:hypothetical protein